jgi:hypothetical protein
MTLACTCLWQNVQGADLNAWVNLDTQKRQLAGAHPKACHLTSSTDIYLFACTKMSVMPAATATKTSVPLWRPEGATAEDIGTTHEVHAQDASIQIWGQDVLETVEKEMDVLDEELRKLSLDIHGV